MAVTRALSITAAGGQAETVLRYQASGFTLVSDADYAMTALDLGVVFTKLTASRTVTLPLTTGLVDPAQQLRIIDASGACSAATPINVQPYSTSGADAIGGGNFSLISAYQWVDLIVPIPALWVYR